MSAARRSGVILRNMTGVWLTRGDSVLLLWKTAGRVVRETWCPTAGGHFDPEELNDPLSCVLRELKEETGMEGIVPVLRYVALRRVGEEIRQNYYYFASLADDVPAPSASTEGILRWFALSELPGLSMPYSARAVLEHWTKIGRYTDALYCGAAASEGAVFTELSDF